MMQLTLSKKKAVSSRITAYSEVFWFSIAVRKSGYGKFDRMHTVKRRSEFGR